MKEMDDRYDLESAEMPYLSGASLKLFVSLLEGPLRGLLISNLFDSAGISQLREMDFDEAPTMYPYAYEGQLASEDGHVPVSELPESDANAGPGFRFATTYDYAQAYREGSTDPEQVAEKALAAIKDSNQAEPPMRAMIAVDEGDVLAQARAAKERIQKGEALSVFDGVPVAIKDEVDMVPYPTTVGTAFLGSEPAVEDSTVAARMRAAGALLIGKANMHEIGIGVTGFNRHHGTARNPYNPDHYTGGSSSGPAGAVAGGLCPAAIGADGGGSIRIPSSFCGLVGLKATFGRVSEYGAADLAWSVAHLGPIAATATDAALMYGVIAGPDLKDEHSLHQPAPTLSGWDQADLTGLRLGVYESWFNHANQETVSACQEMVRALEQRGAQVSQVTIPDLEACRVAHLITIAGEMTQALDHYDKQHRKDYSLEVRTNLALAREFTGRDYIKAQRVRSRMIANFRQVMKEVDVILTPATGIPAPEIKATALPDGDSDLTTLAEIMRFTPIANMTGLPAIAFPVGYTANGLPLGMQAIGRAWEEPTLLRLALAAEQVVERQKPQVWYQIL
jgi:Asp-tRNA(Asn)/Glu-tRNA(Gln) amidotransferase A subunit family amidase